MSLQPIFLLETAGNPNLDGELTKRFPKTEKNRYLSLLESKKTRNFKIRGRGTSSLIFAPLAAPFILDCVSHFNRVEITLKDFLRFVGFFNLIYMV